MGLFLKTGYMYKNQNNLTKYSRITNLRDLYYSQGKRNWRVHTFTATYCKRQEVFKIKLADSAGVCPKGYHIPSRMAWPSWKEQIVWWSCSWLSPFPSCPGGGADSHSDMPPLHVDQIRWLVGDCEGLQVHPASWEPFTKCHAERLAGICILSPRGKSNYDWQIRKLGRLIFCMLWQFMESKGFSLPARL